MFGFFKQLQTEHMADPYIAMMAVYMYGPFVHLFRTFASEHCQTTFLAALEE